MPFKNNNVALGIPETDPFQVGRSDIDDNARIDVEKNVGIPWCSDPSASWLYFDCTIGVMLDSGIVVHNRMPQVNNIPDTLSSSFLEDLNIDTVKGPGVNLNSIDQYKDIVQRMGHSRYWFRLWGQALRAGYRVPIPGIKLIGGVKAIPYDRNPQWAFNRIFPGGNNGGVIIWHAQWSLWYTTASPPTSQSIPEVDPSAHTNGLVPPPEKFVQVPYSQADDNFSASSPAGSLIRTGVGSVAKEGPISKIE